MWLSENLDARWRATGLPLSEVIRRGLDAIEGEPDMHRALAEVRDELAALRSAVAASGTRAGYGAGDYSYEPYEPDP